LSSYDINPILTNKICTKKRWKIVGNIPHELMTDVVIDTKKLSKKGIYKIERQMWFKKNTVTSECRIQTTKTLCQIIKTYLITEVLDCCRKVIYNAENESLLKVKQGFAVRMMGLEINYHKSSNITSEQEYILLVIFKDFASE